MSSLLVRRRIASRADPRTPRAVRLRVVPQPPAAVAAVPAGLPGRPRAAHDDRVAGARVALLLLRRGGRCHALDLSGSGTYILTENP